MPTPRQIFNQIMHYQRPERVFNWNWTFGAYGGDDQRGTQFWQQTIDRWHTEGLPEEVNNQEHVNRFFQVDHRLMLYLRTGLWPAFKKDILEETDQFTVSVNEDGEIIKEFTGTGAEGSMPEYLSHLVSSPADWERLKKERLDPDSPGRDSFEIRLDGQILIESAPGASNFEQARSLLGTSELPVDLFVSSMFGWPRNWMSLQGISYALYDNEELVADMVAHLGDLALSVIQRVLGPLNASIDLASWWEDMAYNGGPLISPRLFRRLMVPQYMRVNQELYRQGVRLIGVDSDGNCEKLIGGWLEAGINCVFPNEAAAGSDVLALRQQFGPLLRLIGGLDKRALASGPAAIQAELDRRLPLIAQGGYLPAVDHSVPPDISLDNYCFYMKYQSEQCQCYLNDWKALSS